MLFVFRKKPSFVPGCSTRNSDGLYRQGVQLVGFRLHAMQRAREREKEREQKKRLLTRRPGAFCRGGSEDGAVTPHLRRPRPEEQRCCPCCSYTARDTGSRTAGAERVRLHPGRGVKERAPVQKKKRRETNDFSEKPNSRLGHCDRKNDFVFGLIFHRRASLEPSLPLSLCHARTPSLLLGRRDGPRRCRRGAVSDARRAPSVAAASSRVPAPRPHLLALLDRLCRSPPTQQQLLRSPFLRLRPPRHARRWPRRLPGRRPVR